MSLDHRLIGRDDAVARIDAAARRDHGPNVVVVTGEAGIGKSRLIQHVIDERRREGWRVLLGSCVEVSGEPIPYAPIASALRLLRRDLPDTDEVAHDLDVILGIDTRDEPRDFAELFELALSIVQRLAERDHVVLALEDLHWADAGTLDMISFLLRTLDANVLLLLTYRNEDFQRTPMLSQLNESLIRSRQATRVELSRLSRSELGELAEAVTGFAPEPAAVERLYERSGGNPFIAEELLVANSDVDVPSSVHDILLARAAQLDSDAEHLVRVTALIGRAVGHDLLAEASQLDDAVLATAVRQAVGSGLVVVDAVREEYAFRHVLTQEAVRERILPSERRRLHAAIAAALARDPDVHTSAGRAAEWAAHVLATGDRIDAIPALLSAGRLSAGTFAYVAAWRQYHRAIGLLDSLDTDIDGVDRREIYTEGADIARWAGEIDAAVELAGRAEALCTTDEQRAGLAESLGRYLVDAGQFDDAEASYERAAALAADVTDTALHARIEASTARLLMLTGRYSQAIPRAQGALELAAALDVPGERGRAYTALGMSEVLLGEGTLGLEHIRLGHELVHEYGDLDDRRRADSNLSFALLIAGRTSEACAIGVSGLQTMRRYGLATANGGALTSNTIVLLRVSGRWTEADELCDELEQQGLPSGMALRIALSRTELDLARGHLELARAQLDKARDLARGQTTPEVLGDLLLAESAIALGHGDLEAAVTAVDAALAVEDRTPRMTVRTCLLALRIEAELADLTRSPKRDELAAPRIERLRDLLTTASAISPSPELDAYALTGAGEHARAVRRPDSELWQDAAQRWAALERPRGEAYSLLRHGEAELLQRRTAGARVSLARSHRIATEVGAEPIATGVRTMAVRARVPLEDVLKTDPAPAGNRPRLTPRELQVLAELVDGARNREIAEKFYLSPRTVGVHVSNLLSKLGVRTRSEAVREAARLKLFDTS